MISAAFCSCTAFASITAITLERRLDSQWLLILAVEERTLELLPDRGLASASFGFEEWPSNSNDSIQTVSL